MDIGEVVLVSSRLALGAVASFLAILLWSKTRDVAWMLMVAGTVASYADTVFAVLLRFGVADGSAFAIGSVPLASIIFPNLPTAFFIAAFSVMVSRKLRKR